MHTIWRKRKFTADSYKWELKIITVSEKLAVLRSSVDGAKQLDGSFTKLASWFSHLCSIEYLAM